MKRIISMVILACVAVVSWAGPFPPDPGGDVIIRIGLGEALDIALENNRTLINARYEVEIARRTYLSTLAGGLPQVAGSATLNDNLKLMTQLIPAEIFEGPAGEYIPVQFGTKYNANYGINATQLLFNAPYIVGLQTAKLLEELSRQGLEKTEMEVMRSVAGNYFLVLVAERSLEIIRLNRENLKKTLFQSRKMQEAGMREATDVDKISVSVSMLENTIHSTQLGLELNYNLLRFQLGLDPETELELTGSLDEILREYNTAGTESGDFTVENHIDYQLLTTQVTLAEKNLRLERSAYLPSLSGYYSYTRQGMDNELAISRWFPSSMIGLQLSVPVFNSGMKYHKVKKARVELEKALNTRELVAAQLSLAGKQTRDNLATARLRYKNQSENVAVARRVMESTEKKYEQGMASVFNLIQANTDYLQAESDLLGATLELLNAHLELELLLSK